VIARYKLARAARRDLQEISDYLTAEAGEDTALRIVRGILRSDHHRFTATKRRRRGRGIW
jgi:plasmid stabilization system protein ParE